MCYSLHPNLSILWQTVTKIIETHYTFIKKSTKKTLDLLKITQNPPSPWLNVVSSLKKPCHAVKTRNVLPISKQRWLRGEGTRVSLFLSLIVGFTFGILGPRSYFNILGLLVPDLGSHFWGCGSWVPPRHLDPTCSCPVSQVSLFRYVLWVCLKIFFLTSSPAHLFAIRGRQKFSKIALGTRLYFLILNSLSVSQKQQAHKQIKLVAPFYISD